METKISIAMNKMVQAHLKMTDALSENEIVELSNDFHMILDSIKKTHAEMHELRSRIISLNGGHKS